jgi:hypothetical protein
MPPGGGNLSGRKDKTKKQPFDGSTPTLGKMRANSSRPGAHQRFEPYGAKKDADFVYVGRPNLSNFEHFAQYLYKTASPTAFFRVKTAPAQQTAKRQTTGSNRLPQLP